MFRGKVLIEAKFWTSEEDVVENTKDYLSIDIDDTIEYEYELINDMSKVSDGSHTFDELYYHRMILFSIICNSNKDKSWKSWKHEDGTMYDDYFIVGITTTKGDYTYHYHKDNWKYFKVKELEFAPKWDGHQPSDITRLLSL